jgi:hypothetical protein
MVRSYWMGSVFGVLATAGLAWSQTTPVAAAPGGMQDRYITVREPGQPAQRCKILKTWTEPDGTPVFQAQALDTGELMTIEESGANGPRLGSAAGAIAMRVFHWGQGGAIPWGTPEPPPSAKVVGYAIDIHAQTAPAARIAVVAAPAQRKPRFPWPTPFAQVNTTDLALDTDRVPPTPPAKRIVLAPIGSAPVVAALPRTKPKTAAVASPYNLSAADAAAIKPAPLRPAVKSEGAAGSPYAVTSAATPAVSHPAVSGSPYVIKPLGTTSQPPQPPVVMVLKPSAPSTPPVAAPKVDAPLPPPPPGPMLATPLKTELPHAEPRHSDPLATPDKFAKIPPKDGLEPEKPAPAKTAPLLASLALQQPPATLHRDAKDSAPHKTATPPALPPLPGPVSTAPLAAVSKPESAPAAPLGQASAAAAVSPELSAPAKPAPLPAAPGASGVSIRAKKTNAFTDKPHDGAPAVAANAFSTPPAAPPPDSETRNAFTAAPSEASSAPAMETTPPPATTNLQAPTGYVVPAGLPQESGYNLPQLSSILHDSLYPSQREWAAESLASMDWRREPRIVDLLIERANQDPAPTVRAECVRSLGRMNANTAAAVAAVKGLQSDSDDRVRQEAVEAYEAMTGAASH